MKSLSLIRDRSSKSDPQSPGGRGTGMARSMGMAIARAEVARYDEDAFRISNHYAGRKARTGCKRLWLCSSVQMRDWRRIADRHLRRSPKEFEDRQTLQNLKPHLYL